MGSTSRAPYSASPSAATLPCPNIAQTPANTRRRSPPISVHCAAMARTRACATVSRTCRQGPLLCGRSGRGSRVETQAATSVRKRSASCRSMAASTEIRPRATPRRHRRICYPRQRSRARAAVAAATSPARCGGSIASCKSDQECRGSMAVVRRDHPRTPLPGTAVSGCALEQPPVRTNIERVEARERRATVSLARRRAPGDDLEQQLACLRAAEPQRRAAGCAPGPRAAHADQPGGNATGTGP